MYKVVLTVMMLVYQLVNIPQAMDVQAFELHFRIDLYPIKRNKKANKKSIRSKNKYYLIIDSTNKQHTHTHKFKHL